MRESKEVNELFLVPAFVAFPFPQVFLTHDEIIVAGQDWVQTAVDGVPPLLRANVNTYDFFDKGTPKALAGGGVWHYAEATNCWFLTNGIEMVVKTFADTNLGLGERVYVIDSVPVNTLCEFKSRLIFGGFTAGSFWNDEWNGIFDLWMEQAPHEVAYGDILAAQPGAKFIWWTSIGGGDALSLFDPPSNPLDLFERNEMGFMPMPWKGEVLAILPLDKSFIVYGDRGIARLRPVNEPYPTFAMDKILSIGIQGRGAVGGDTAQHLFLDTEGDLWSITEERGPQRLGYREYLDQMDADPITISLDRKERTFYINGLIAGMFPASFVLTPNGLGTNAQHVTSLINTHGDIYGVVQDIPGNSCYVVTDLLDFRYRDLKTITTVELGMETDPGVTVDVAVDFGYDHDAALRTSDWVRVNKQGFARIQKTANEFRLKIRASDFAGFKLDYANVKWQAPALRTLRGLGVGISRTESGE